jgi:hypothetical protein
LNRIEEAFSKVKVLLKKAAARTKEALMETLAGALGPPRRRTRGWLAHPGYEMRDRSL